MKLDEIIERACVLVEVKNEAQLAKEIGITQSAFGNRKRRGTAHELIFDWAMKNNYDLNFLFYGKEKESQTISEEPLYEIQDWLKEKSKMSPEFKIWFKIQFENKFPEFIEWKKGKEEEPRQSDISGNSNVA